MCIVYVRVCWCVSVCVCVWTRRRWAWGPYALNPKAYALNPEPYALMRTSPVGGARDER